METYAILKQIMLVEIDQSGKIEDTAVDTVIGAADVNNKFEYSVKLPAREKRKLQQLLRTIGKKSLFPYQVFATLIFLAICNKISAIHEIAIDEEYTGQEEKIKLHLHRLLIKIRPGISARYITFRRIGRKSSAHSVAINTYRKQRETDDVITARKIIKYLV